MGKDINQEEIQQETNHIEKDQLETNNLNLRNSCKKIYKMEPG